MSLTDTARHWLRGCALWTAASRSDVNVAMPHLRGKWSPTKAILWTLEVSCVRHSFAQHIRKPELNILYASTCTLQPNPGPTDVLRKLVIVVALVRMNHDGGFVRRLGRAYGDNCCRGPCISPFSFWMPTLVGIALVPYLEHR